MLARPLTETTCAPISANECAARAEKRARLDRIYPWADCPARYFVFLIIRRSTSSRRQK